MQNKLWINDGALINYVPLKSIDTMSLFLSSYYLCSPSLTHSSPQIPLPLELLQVFTATVEASKRQTPCDRAWNPAVLQNQVSEIDRLVSYKGRRDRCAAVALCQPVMKSFVIFIHSGVGSLFRNTQ